MQQQQPITYLKSFHQVLIRFHLNWLIQKAGHFILRSINLLIWNKEDLPEHCKEWTVLIYKKHDKTDCTNYRGISLLSTTYKILSYVLLSRLTPYTVELFGIVSVGFDITGQLLIIYSAFIKCLKKMEYNKAVHQLFRLQECL